MCLVFVYVAYLTHNVHFNFKHVCTHSLGLFVHTHLENLVQLVHTRSLFCDKDYAQSHGIFDFAMSITCSLYSVILLVKYFFHID